jgi:Uma2 family endonuclease
MGPALKTDRPATLEDLEALPPGVKGEVIDGVLYAQPRPRARHAAVEMGMGHDLYGAFHRGRGGPGGWWILQEPGIQVPRAAEFSPDLAGWRRTTLPALPPDTDPIRVVPDWVCEVLSPSTRSYDNVVKRRFYAEIGVGHLWYVDPGDRTLAVSRQQEGLWVEVGVWGRDARVRAEPFADVELDLAAWWGDPPAARP